MGQVIFTLENFLPVKPNLVVSMETVISSSKPHPQQLMLSQNLNSHPCDF